MRCANAKSPPSRHAAQHWTARMQRHQMAYHAPRRTRPGTFPTIKAMLLALACVKVCSCLVYFCCAAWAKQASLSRCDHFQANLLSQQRLQALLGSRQIDARITSSTVYETRSAPPLQLLMTMIGKSFVGDVKFRQPASQRTANGKRQAISCALLH